MSEKALITTGLVQQGFDESGYYAVFTFSTDGDPYTIFYPTELLDQLAEAALLLLSQRSDLSGPNPTMQAFRVRNANVRLADDGQTVALTLEFGAQAQIRFAIPRPLAAQLGAFLQQPPPSSSGAPNTGGE